MPGCIRRNATTRPTPARNSRFGVRRRSQREPAVAPSPWSFGTTAYGSVDWNTRSRAPDPAMRAHHATSCAVAVSSELRSARTCRWARPAGVRYGRSRSGWGRPLGERAPHRFGGGPAMTYALVLGGGGIPGVAWETGLLHGLHEAGLDLTGADLFLGTSSGSLVGAQVATGVPLDGLYRRQRVGGDRGAERPPELGPLVEFFAGRRPRNGALRTPP